MPTPYSSRFRFLLCQRLVAGESVRPISVATSVREATLFRWGKQALIDAGQLPGNNTQEKSHLRAAKKRIKESETELQLVKDACALIDASAVVPPKGYRPLRKD